MSAVEYSMIFCMNSFLQMMLKNSFLSIRSWRIVLAFMLSSSVKSGPSLFTSFSTAICYLAWIMARISGSYSESNCTSSLFRTSDTDF